jgi:hypothetical protein
LGRVEIAEVKIADHMIGAIKPKLQRGIGQEAKIVVAAEHGAPPEN